MTVGTGKGRDRGVACIRKRDNGEERQLGVGGGERGKGDGEGLTTYPEDPEQANQHSNVREHHTERDHGNPLSNDVVDEEVAAAGQRCANQAGDTGCTTHTTTRHRQTDMTSD